MNRTVVALVAAILLGCSASNHIRKNRVDDRATFNALWNDSGAGGGRGFWVYARTGGCPDLRDGSDLPLVFGTFAAAKGTTEELDVTELEYCFQLPPRDRIRNMARCIKGHVQLRFSGVNNQYRGNYSFSLSDGTAREGTFEAVFCPKRTDA